MRSPDKLVQSDAGSSLFAPGKRRRINLVAIVLNVFTPWIVFAGIFGVMSFSFHYDHPMWSWLTVVAGYGGVGMALFLAWRASTMQRDALWFKFAAGAIFVAVTLGAISGDMNFWYNMQPFYDIENLNTYPSVNTARETGTQLMDAGRIYFGDGTILDSRKSMGFKALDLYCVAPIVHGEEPMNTYDFWAVGTNCCSGVSSDFRCGEFNNPHARSGLRLMRDDQRPFFRLAVQQAEAAYNIQSVHPLFFYWMQDPVAEMNKYRNDGFRYYLLGIATYFAASVFTTACAVVGFSKIGRY